MCDRAPLKSELKGRRQRSMCVLRWSVSLPACRAGVHYSARCHGDGHLWVLGFMREELDSWWMETAASWILLISSVCEGWDSKYFQILQISDCGQICHQGIAFYLNLW